MYRAGSIFNTDTDYSSYFSDPDYVEDSRYNASYNAGDFGRTTSIDGTRPGGPTPLEPKTNGRSPIGIPSGPPSNGSDETPYIPDENDSEYKIPSIQDVIRSTTPSSSSGSTPGIDIETPKPSWPTPGTRPSTLPNAPAAPTAPTETMPFTPEVSEPSITIEELRRLDPSVTDIKIINIDDAINTAFPNDTGVRQ